jgi:hypothetical protein
VDASQQPAQRRLARPRRADDGQSLARHQVEVHAVEHVASGAVGEADVLGHQPLVRRLLVAGDPVVGHHLHAEDPRQRGGADLHLVEPGDQPVNRVHDLHGVERDRGDRAEGGVTVRDQPAAPGQ